VLVIDLTNFSMLIPNKQQNWSVGIALWIVLGLIVGFIGSKIFNKTGYGLIRDCLLGVVGAIVGGCLSNMIGKFSGRGLEFYGELVAVIGAVVFMFVYYALSRRGVSSA
jgi:uncharacterized membrane protein YeaQ/YmgE (transglycosylase-associated protein family)